MTGADKLKRECEALTEMIRTAETGLRSDKVVRFKDFEARANAICSRIKTLSPTEARDLQPVLADMIAALDLLEGDLNRFINTNRGKEKHG